uniref:Uncharacterized protein n=2 Tax=Equus TaxID=9789 RepID=A0A9L0SKW5_HORSE
MLKCVWVGGGGSKVLIDPHLLFSLPSKLTCFLPRGVARGHRDQCQASGRWLQAASQECECKAIISLFQIGS